MSALLRTLVVMGFIIALIGSAMIAGGTLGRRNRIAYTAIALDLVLLGCMVYGFQS